MMRVIDSSDIGLDLNLELLVTYQVTIDLVPWHKAHF
jgi:hypothetical protein